MRIFGLIVFFLSSSTFAAVRSYDLKMDLSLNGKSVSSPRLLVNEGEKAMIFQKTETEENFIEVIATEGEFKNHKGIMMKFTVGVIDKNGEKKILSQPQILANENQTSLITSQSKSGGSVTQQLSLSVVAKRKIQ